ncbi:MAG TPA: 5-formyltetrahydrofolate cyclo-ligase [Pyrinomonadaceae bacterium]|jgi:5-formyltetrahydrofolate cyclo-ligase|nr:5-formyltetrahydrofolate cyclo-ligase [Pyrinomonadaceae bacterium]
MVKSELRKIYLEKTAAISSADRDLASCDIASHFFTYFDELSIHSLHCFLPIEKFNEIDTTRIIHGVWKNHPQVKVVVPRVNFETDEMESIPYTADSETKHNRWLIPEPLEGEMIDAVAIDLVIVPLVCVDKSGHRVGYGKGFYDRFLKQVRTDCVKVGLSYFPPVASIEDVHEGDVPLDFVVTPEMIYRGDAETQS